MAPGLTKQVVFEALSEGKLSVQLLTMEFFPNGESITPIEGEISVGNLAEKVQFIFSNTLDGLKVITLNEDDQIEEKSLHVFLEGNPDIAKENITITCFDQENKATESVSFSIYEDLGEGFTPIPFDENDMFRHTELQLLTDFSSLKPGDKFIGGISNLKLSTGTLDVVYQFTLMG